MRISAFVSSVTEDRLEQVQAFRDGELTILISTTILERGVTFPCVDVFVVEANHRLFTKSSLIQIGGELDAVWIDQLVSCSSFMMD